MSDFLYSEMVDRVAQAIQVSFGDPPEEIKESNLRAAAAAIKAIREPTEAMKDAAMGSLEVSYDCSRGDIDGLWRAMIDEALK